LTCIFGAGTNTIYHCANHWWNCFSSRFPHWPGLTKNPVEQTSKNWIGLRENVLEPPIFIGKKPWFHVDFLLNQSNEAFVSEETIIFPFGQAAPIGGEFPSHRVALPSDRPTCSDIILVAFFWQFP